MHRLSGTDAGFCTAKPRPGTCTRASSWCSTRRRHRAGFGLDALRDVIRQAPPGARTVPLPRECRPARHRRLVLGRSTRARPRSPRQGRVAAGPGRPARARRIRRRRVLAQARPEPAAVGDVARRTVRRQPRRTRHQGAPRLRRRRPGRAALRRALRPDCGRTPPTRKQRRSPIRTRTIARRVPVRDRVGDPERTGARRPGTPHGCERRRRHRRRSPCRPIAGMPPTRSRRDAADSTVR